MSWAMIFTMLLALCAHELVNAYTPVASLGKDDKCESLTYDVCRKMDYNRTLFPNYLGHRKQSEAALTMTSLKPLLEVGCSPDILTFACSIYFPMCTSINQIIPPCRSLCEDVYQGCSALMKKFGYPWPDDWKCDQFPVIKTAICVFQNRTGVPRTKPTFSSIAKVTSTRKPTRKVAKSSRKPHPKYCSADKNKSQKSKSRTQKDCCKCCMRGNRAARTKNFKCTLRKSYSTARSFVKTLKECSSRKNKRCYIECCKAKKASAKKGSGRRNNRRNRKKTPVG